MLGLSQIGGMIRYEFLLQWRRRALVVVFLAAMAIPIVGALNVARELAEVSGAWVRAGGYSSEAAQRVTTANLILVTWAPMYITLLLILPIVVADTIPRDRQMGVRELLDTLPLTPATYLTGKLLSLWASLLAGISVALFINGLIWLVLIGSFDWSAYGEMGLIGVGSLVILNSGLSLLLAAGQPTRPRAILVGVAVSAVCLYSLVPGIREPETLWAGLNVSRPALFVYYTWGRLGATIPANFQARTLNDVSWTLILGGAQMIALWAIVWGWMRWRAVRVS